VDGIRILIADEHPEETSRIREILHAAGGFKIVGEAASGEDALMLTGALSPDIALVDVELSRQDGGHLTLSLRLLFPTTTIILLSARPSEEELFHAIRYGAAAYLSKEVGPRDLVGTVKRVRGGKYVIDDNVLDNPTLATRVLSAFRELAAMDQQVKPLFVPLSAREIEVLENAAQGSSNKQIARAMSISEQTVKNHLTSIMRKLAVNDRTHAVVYALRHGWIKVPDL